MCWTRLSCALWALWFLVCRLFDRSPRHEPAHCPEKSMPQCMQMPSFESYHLYKRATAQHAYRNTQTTHRAPYPTTRIGPRHHHHIHTGLHPPRVTLHERPTATHHTGPPHHRTRRTPTPRRPPSLLRTQPKAKLPETHTISNQTRQPITHHERRDEEERTRHRSHTHGKRPNTPLLPLHATDHIQEPTHT